MLIHWIWFSQLSGLQTRQKITLLERFRDPEEIYNASSFAFAELDIDFQKLEDKDLSRAQAVLDQCSRGRIGILTYTDSAYPSRLRNVEDPPLVLYYKGMLPDWESVPPIGVVGTRKASVYGLQIAKKLGAEIACGGGLLISGGAAGIDAEAMAGAMEAGYPAVAVLGCGVDVVFPKSNEALFEKTQKMGCLLSEYPPETPAYSWNFPRRNRIISGISCGLLVVEAPLRSGALITARYAWDQGRDVFVVPGNITADTCAGSNQLLQDRAIPVFTGWDVLKEYTDLYPGKLSRKEVALPRQKVAQTIEMPAQKKSSRPKSDKNSVDIPEKSNYSVLENTTASLTQEEKELLRLIPVQPVGVDEVIAAAKLPAQKVLSMLTILALKGVIQNHPGKRVSLR